MILSLFALMLAQPTLYTHATVIDGTGAAPMADTDLLVQDDRIAAIGQHGTIPGAGAHAVDLTGKFVMPGLIDSHVHLATPPNRKRAEAVLRRQLYGGVTGVRSMADDDRAVAELARASEQREIDAPDIAFAALMAGRPFFADPRVAVASKGWAPGTAPWMQAIDDRTDLRLAVARAKGAGATAIKIYADLPARLVRAITAEAHRQGMKVWAHSAVFPTRPADVIAAGPDSVSHVCYLAYQAEPVMLAAYEDRTPVHEERLAATGDDPVMAPLFAAMKRRGVLLDATGALFANADPAKRRLRCTGDLTARLTAQAWRAGVTISAGTDSSAGAERQWPELYDELDFLSRKSGMPPLAVIRAATLNGAVAMGRAGDTGSLTKGKRADFIVLARNPAADIANIRSIEMTVKAGHEYPRSAYRSVTPEEMKEP